MPPVSEAQRKWAWANKDKKTKEGKAAAEFAAADPGGKLPAHKKKGAVDRSSHFKGNPGFPSSPQAASPPPATYQAHESRERSVMGAGYKQHERGSCTPHRVGGGPSPLRMSGHKGAHQIGKRR